MLSNVDKSCAPNYGMMLLWASLANAIPVGIKKIEPPHYKTNKITCAPNGDSGGDQHGHSPSLIRVFAVHMKKL